MRNEFDVSAEREAQRTLLSYLHEGETLLWSGRPYRSHPYRPSIAAMVFMLFWCGFSVFWTVTASLSAGWFGLFGLPFVAVGVFMLYQLLLGQRNRFYNTIYAVTDNRMIVLTASRKGLECTEYPYEYIAFLNYTEVKNGAGNITFLPVVMPQNHTGRHFRSNFGWGRVRRYSNNGDERQECGFYMIDDVKTVFVLLSEQISKKNRTV